LPDMQIELIRDLASAEKIWKYLSPNEIIFDEWDFRYAFYKHDPQEIFFYAGYENNEPISLLPLEYFPELEYLDFFGGEFMDSSRCFIKEGREKIIPEMYKAIGHKAALFDIIGEDDFTRSFAIDDYSYYLPLDGIPDFNGHLEKSFSSKRRKNFRYLMRDFENNCPGLELQRISPNQKTALLHANGSENINDILSRLFELNISRHLEESYLSIPAIQKGVRDIANSEFDIKILSARINGIIEGVYFGVIYNGTFYSLLVGSNNSAYPGLGNYMQIQFIDWAIELGAKKFDAGLGDCGWKINWHFEREPQFEWSNY
jgi:CelD/BcsL family acetyltransferase involved in cellulose biosynthesis